MLRACRRVLRPAGVMVFFVIEAAPGLSPAGRRRAKRAGPASVLTRTSYPSLLATAGFVDVEVEDRTEEYRETQRRWIVATERWADELGREVGDEMLRDRLRDRRASLAAIDDGVLIRRLYTGVAPDRRRDRVTE